MKILTNVVTSTTHCLPFSGYEPQVIKLGMITVSNAELMEHLQKGKYWTLQQNKYTPTGDTTYEKLSTLHKRQ